ncbi:hypothetical protein JTB14_000224 [Gonioctena quinquepunctata]|nr:hypothetical protein JTB14_000224 [Gonioctena quinquepunctata]
MTFDNTAIDWFPRKPSVVASSTTETEFIAATVGEIVIMAKSAQKLGIYQLLLPLKVRNQSAIREKLDIHRNVQYHFIRDAVGKRIHLNYVRNERQLADIFTRTLSKD